MLKTELSGHYLHLVNLEFPFPFKPKEVPALGVWQRIREGEDNKYEIYVPGHNYGYKYAFGGEFGENPDGIPQTKIELEPDKVTYLGGFVY